MLLEIEPQSEFDLPRLSSIAGPTEVWGSDRAAVAVELRVVDQILDLDSERHSRSGALIEVGIILPAAIVSAAIASALREVTALAAIIALAASAKITTATTTALRRSEVVRAQTGITGSVCRPGTLAAFEAYCFLKTHLNVELTRTVAFIAAKNGVSGGITGKCLVQLGKR